MRIRSFVHKGPRRLYTDDNSRGVPADAVGRLRKMLAFMQEMGSVEELHSIPVWRAHPLTGDRKRTWGLHVTRNWRLAFRVDADK
jgi:proteic killer suppression protein